jgi:predicted MFS family arabinose efflux permease
LITLGAGVYTLHVVLMPIWVDTPYLWLGTLIAGVGGTAAISLPISYFQDLLRDRPGAASAMLALQRLVADILGASVFALGTWIGGYETVAVMSALLTLRGAGLLYLADRQRWLMG